MVVYIICAIVMFGVLIAVHEFGHFWTAKVLGVKVNEFSIGMGPQLLKKQRGETMYSLRAFPVGGFCAMEGEDEETGDPRAFTAQKIWKRIIILVAGSAMNFLLGLIIICVIYSSAEGFYTPVIGELFEGFPLEGENGLMVGDRIVSIDSEHVWMYSDISLLLSRGVQGDFDIVIERGGEKLELEHFPLTLKEYEIDGQTVQRYGLVFDVTEATLGAKLKYSLCNSFDFVRLVRMSLFDLITGKARVKDLSGPVGIVGYMTQVGTQSETAKDAAENVAYFAALVAVNLAVMNMLPLPALDGGRIFFMLVTWVIEKLIRRRIDPKYEGYIHMAGLVLFLLLMVVVTYSDIVRLISGNGA
ncbi:MAG: site-2 protease family protein [Oscillospiraceae bacterium]|nr:site-2 protease family protein [Oscillospiraceae bacterium]